MTVGVLLVALSISVCLTVGQLLFKKAALSLGDVSSWSAMIPKMLSNLWLVSGMALYLCTTVAWVLLLRTAPISVVYPVTALSFLFVPVASHLVFGEAYSWRLLLCGVLICSGIALAGYEPR
ncbi:MAG: hypothetical protein AAGA61_01655 [Pseudomonadota bacterium]